MTVRAPTGADAESSTTVGPEAENGIALSRWLLAMVSVALYLGGRSFENPRVVLHSTAVAIVVLAVPLLAPASRRVFQALSCSPTASAVVLQLIDTASVISMTVLAGRLAADTSWALSSVVIVIAALRFGAVGVLVTWAAVSAGHVMLSSLHVQSVPSALLLQRSGALLAVAAVIALLTSWLQAGWETQAQMTRDAERRSTYLRAIEDAGRAMQGVPTAQLPLVALEHALRLDFEAASTCHPDEAPIAVGNGDLVPSDLTLDTKPDVIEVTAWTGATGVTSSISVVERRTGKVITGWTTGPTSRAQAEAFGELVLRTTARIELGQMLDAARLEAQVDPLTGLWRRHVFDHHLETAAAGTEPVAVLFFDLDYFKQINDRYGHQIGDATLSTAGQRLRHFVGHNGLVARYGGDEFVVVLSGPVALLAHDLATEVSPVINAPFFVDGRRIPLGATVGVAIGRAPMSPAALIQQADEAVLAAKSARNARTGGDGRSQPPAQPAHRDHDGLAGRPAAAAHS